MEFYMGITRSRKTCGFSLLIILFCSAFLCSGKGYAQEWEWQNPLPQGNNLNSVWSNSSNDVYAVGYNGTILHYDGATWNTMSSGTSSDLWCIWGSSGNDLFAVGNNGTILHFNGSTWSAMASSTTSYLWGIWGSSNSDVFAVGYNGTILHYNGTEWTGMNSGTNTTLRGIGVIRALKSML